MKNKIDLKLSAADEAPIDKNAYPFEKTEEISSGEVDTGDELINDGHQLEVMDRMSIIASNLNDFVLEHPLVYANEELEMLVEQALELIYQAYQLVGNLSGTLVIDGE